VKWIVLSLCCLVFAGQTARAGEMLPLRDAVPATSAGAEPAAMWDGGGDEAATGAPISPAKAALYSLLLPGLGDYQLGNKGRASMFFAAEGVIWISYAMFETQGHQREDDYQDLAVRFAGVSRTGHSDDFYAHVREFDNAEEYEADLKLEGRQKIYEASGSLEDLNADALEKYFVDNRVSDYEPWQWDSLEKRLQYSEVRSSSKTSYRRADYMLVAAVANRLVSAVVAYTAAHSMEPKTVGYHLDFNPAARGVDVTFALTRSF
jgi:hypothetical protein